MYNNLIAWLENNQAECMYKKHLGVSCPGCGAQSALIELLKGNIWESITLYPALLPIIIFGCFLISSIFINFKNRTLIIKVFSVLIILLIFGNYFIKILI